jgi:hypothetical protein
MIQQILPLVRLVYLGQWGNWVIQHLLEHGTRAEQDHIISVVLQDVVTMSLDQYASKVVEKCVRIATKPQIGLFIAHITSQPSYVRLM